VSYWFQWCPPTHTRPTPAWLAVPEITSVLSLHALRLSLDDVQGHTQGCDLGRPSVLYLLRSVLYLFRHVLNS
jgi:hypothetical protein